jgi:hypothetical protein
MRIWVSLNSNNMKKVLIIAFICIATLNLNAQNGDVRDKIESARIALITERLGLSPDQAEKFWPVYREYSLQRQDIRKDFIAARRELDGNQLSEEQSQKLLQMGMQLKERELNIDRNYNDRLTKVISSRQMLELRKAEQDFKRMLLERLQKRDVDRERLNQRMQKRDNNE